MKLHNRKELQDFTHDHPDAQENINAWVAEIEISEWQSPHEMKQRYPKASILGDQQVVFNICGNRYRLLTLISYQHGIVLVKAVDIHKKYDKWRIK